MLSLGGSGERKDSDETSNPDEDMELFDELEKSEGEKIKTTHIKLGSEKRKANFTDKDNIAPKPKKSKNSFRLYDD